MIVTVFESLNHVLELQKFLASAFYTIGTPSENFQA